jgi:acetyl-CoA carboxylase biotin carboxyl carrier protein
MNLNLVEQIVALMGEYPVSEIAVEQDGQRVCVRKALSTAPPVTPAPSAAEAPPATSSEVRSEAVPEEARQLLAPMVGIFHHADPPLPYAAAVRPGQVIGAIESMKLMNDVVAEESGRVTDVLVEDGAPVDYGQPLFRLAA